MKATDQIILAILGIFVMIILKISGCHLTMTGFDPDGPVLTCSDEN